MGDFVYGTVGDDETERGSSMTSVQPRSACIAPTRADADAVSSA